VEDRTSGGRELKPAMLTSVNLAGGNAVKLSIPSAILTLDDFRIPFAAKVIQAGRVIREHLIELLESELYHWAFLGGHRCILYLDSTYMIAKGFINDPSVP
jgi:hypothetical protein